MNGKSLARMLYTWVVITLGVYLADFTSPAIEAAEGRDLLWVALILGLLNALLKPVLLFFTLPFIILTLGLGIWIINAFLLLLAGGLVPGFFVESFWAALWGALVISLTHIVANLFFRSNGSYEVRRRHRARRQARRPARDDVIDI